MMASRDEISKIETAKNKIETVKEKIGSTYVFTNDQSTNYDFYFPQDSSPDTIHATNLIYSLKFYEHLQSDDLI